MSDRSVLLVVMRNEDGSIGVSRVNNIGNLEVRLLAQALQQMADEQVISPDPPPEEEPEEG